MSMNLSAIKAIFFEAIELPEAERVRFLDRRCGDNCALRERVEGLLRADTTCDAARAPATEDVGGHSHGERPGQTVGRYRLVEEIGEGGFGTVWMAEQQEPVQRKVALKVTKVGMDTKQVISRFEAERQALALMEHPNIAMVLDGGATPAGRPYFVMELIEGVAITDYCNKASLRTEDRLELFQQVCHAVQHAHQKGIIHRDLKPSNILVTLHDGVPVPKVIDFGIAKATSSELTQRTLLTAQQQVIGTPAYMSPEQAKLSGIDIDTRADVYSLGVILYELLTGTRPFEADTLAAEGYFEMLRVIREDTPPKPSTRVSTLGKGLEIAAQQRHTTAKHLRRSLSGDLDWIVMRALEKERNRRYATAQELAADIARHLADEPVHAGPPSATYRLSKYVRRHRVGVAAGLVAILALVGGLAAATWGYFEAESQRRRTAKAEEEAVIERDAAEDARGIAETEAAKAQAEEAKAKTEAARANAVVRLVEEMLSSADPERLKGKAYTVRQLLDDFDQGLAGRLKSQPEVELMMRRVMAKAYRGLGAFDRALSNALVRLRLQRRLVGDSPELVGAINDAAMAYRLLERREEAIPLWQEALEMRTRLFGRVHPDVAVSTNNLADARLHQGEHDAANRLYEQSSEIWRTLLQQDHPSMKSMINYAGFTLLARGRAAEAASMFRKAIDLHREHRGETHRSVADSYVHLGNALVRQQNYVDAKAAYAEGLRRRRKNLGDEHQRVARALMLLAPVLVQLREFSAAERMLREAMKIDTKVVGDQHPAVASSLVLLAQVLEAQAKHDDLESIYRRVIAIHTQRFGAAHPPVFHALIRLARFLVKNEEYRKAETELRAATAIAPKHDSQRFLIMTLLGVTLSRQGRSAEAEPLLLRGVEGMGSHERVFGEKTAIDCVVEHYESSGRPAEAAKWAARRRASTGTRK